MSEIIGYLVVSNETGYVLEGRDHAAKVFETINEARSQCQALSQKTPIRLVYDEMVRSLLKGSTFCFSTESGHTRFIKRLRNDPGHKPFLALSQKREFISWRIGHGTSTEDVHHGPGVALRQNPDPIHAPGPSLATGEQAGTFNPDILVREGN